MPLDWFRRYFLLSLVWVCSILFKNQPLWEKYPHVFRMQSAPLRMEECFVLENIKVILQSAKGYLAERFVQEEKQALPALPDVVDQARKEWLDAQHYYNTVSDKDLVDHAVYLMQATEKKYVYLLKTARREGITSTPSIDNISSNPKMSV